MSGEAVSATRTTGELRSKEQVFSALCKLVKLAEKTVKGTMAHQVLQSRAPALAWVLRNEKVPEIVPSKEALKFFEGIY